MQIRDPEAVRKMAASARKQSPVADDPKFSVVRDAEVASPVMVYTPEGEPLFWMVPFLVKNSACGFACVKLSGKVSKLGIFGSAPEDRSSWIDAAFFERPPAHILTEIRERYPEAVMKSPFFSYDESPDEWAWRIEIRHIVQSVVFIAPGGWYERFSQGNGCVPRRSGKTTKHGEI